MSAADAMKAVAGKAVLLDVREAVEWEAGHSPRAVLIPLSRLGSSTLPDWSGRAVMVICRSGQRSQDAADFLRACGVDAYSVDGGMRDWAQLGGEVIASSGEPGRII